MSQTWNDILTLARNNCLAQVTPGAVRWPAACNPRDSKAAPANFGNLAQLPGPSVPPNGHNSGNCGQNQGRNPSGNPGRNQGGTADVTKADIEAATRDATKAGTEKALVAHGLLPLPQGLSPSPISMVIQCMNK